MSSEAEYTFIPSWTYLQKFSSVMSRESFYAPSIGQMGILSSTLIPEFSLPIIVIILSSTSITLLYSAERLIGINSPTELIADQRNYFAELSKITESLKKSFDNMQEIEEKWRLRLAKRAENIKKRGDVALDIDQLSSKATIFPDLVRYKEFFESICDPEVQKSLNFASPGLRTLCFTMLTGGLFSLIASSVLVIHQLWISGT